MRAFAGQQWILLKSDKSIGAEKSRERVDQGSVQPDSARAELKKQTSTSWNLLGASK